MWEEDINLISYLFTIRTALITQKNTSDIMCPYKPYTKKGPKGKQKKLRIKVVRYVH